MSRIGDRKGDLIPNPQVPIYPFSTLEGTEKKEATGGN